MLDCAIGEDITELMMDFWENGQCRQENTVFVLRTTFQSLLTRISQPLVVFFPSTVQWFITPNERDILQNTKNLRSFFCKMVEERRKKL